MVKGLICFDMDGTIADLYNVPNWLECLRKEDVSPYLNAKPLWDMDTLSSILEKLINQNWEVRIISWLSKESSEEYKIAVRNAKLRWLQKYNFPYKKVHMIAYGTTKANSVRKAAKEVPAVLIDDNRKIRDGWHLGETIDPQEGDLLEKLEKLLDK